MGLSTPTLLQQVLSKRIKKNVTDSDLMPAAVLLLIYDKEGAYHVLLNKRSELVEHHKGEISFPGGGRKWGLAGTTLPSWESWTI